MGDGRIVGQRCSDVVLGHAEADLFQIAGIAAQHSHFTPVQASTDNQTVKGVIIGLACPNALERFAEGVAHFAQVDAFAAMFQLKVVNPIALLRRIDIVGALANHAQAEIFHHRQHIRERNLRFAVEQFQVHAACLLFQRAVER